MGEVDNESTRAHELTKKTDGDREDSLTHTTATTFPSRKSDGKSALSSPRTGINPSERVKRTRIKATRSGPNYPEEQKAKQERETPTLLASHRTTFPPSKARILARRSPAGFPMAAAVSSLARRAGGMPGSVNLRECKVLERMVKMHAEKGGLYGAICAAPAVTLAHWGMLKGLKATCYPSFMEKFTAEVIPVNSRVVVDRNVVTSQGPGTAIEFALALVEQLYDKEKMEEVAGPLYVHPQHGADYTIEELNSVEWKCSGTPQVLVPVANGSEEIEALNLIDVLRRAGANVTVASVEDTLQIVTRRHKFNLIADMMLDEAAKMEFDLIVMPGGLSGAQKFASTDKLVDLLKKQAGSGKAYGAICASPAHVLEPHGLLKGKKATAFPPMAHLLTDRSLCENRVVIDGNLITSRAPGTATEFALAIVEKLFGREKAVPVPKNKPPVKNSSEMVVVLMRWYPRSLARRLPGCLLQQEILVAPSGAPGQENFYPNKEPGRQKTTTNQTYTHNKLSILEKQQVFFFFLQAPQHP
ncbi:unnamed protein product [Triticum turgidum subsp. durum]|uniref:DJ-1/PfpI domain-containing protein n=1 Tax=Triticum turgidum subsp. durum TaxID=4567 RepID=A0A9R0REG9_TRITD|nr:unnamed protein product [Triticum turgidum subsp. durum]